LGDDLPLDPLGSAADRLGARPKVAGERSIKQERRVWTPVTGPGTALGADSDAIRAEVSQLRDRSR
jgi:hypothetical protein